jgi:signal transduction histidine kinase
MPEAKTIEKFDILIVDDVRENLLALKSLLARDDVTIFEAQSGANALELMLKHDFCLALLDVRMPEMNGFELAELMRGTSKTKNIPIIFVTAGEKDQNYTFKGYESGAIDFLRKPLDAHSVNSKVNIFLEIFQQKKELRKQVEWLKESGEQKEKLLNELNKTQEKLEQAIRLREEFMAMSSHEIRTPMNAIIGMTQLLLETKLDDEQFKYVNMFQKAGQNLLHIIDDILDISKIDSGKFKIDKVEFNLKTLMDEVMGMLNHQAEIKNLVLTYTLVPEIADCLLGDSFRIKQILVNLIGNSLKFTTVGSITVQVRTNSDQTKKGNLWFLVTDTGIGVTKEQQIKLFEPYTQANSSTAKNYGGSGLGLTISKKLVELMGGEIWIDSKEGIGTNMHFTMDCEKVLPLESSVEIETTKSAKILLVDDSEINRLIVKEYLKNTNYIITEAENGIIALDKATSEKFDIILMDMQMPVMDGFSATLEIRKWEQEQTTRGHTPIIAVTAYTTKEDEEKVLLVGCDQHLAKPILKENLLKVLRDIDQRFCS